MRWHHHSDAQQRLSPPAPILSLIHIFTAFDAAYIVAACNAVPRLVEMVKFLSEEDVYKRQPSSGSARLGTAVHTSTALFDTSRMNGTGITPDLSLIHI